MPDLSRIVLEPKILDGKPVGAVAALRRAGAAVDWSGHVSVIEPRRLRMRAMGGRRLEVGERACLAGNLCQSAAVRKL